MLNAIKLDLRMAWEKAHGCASAYVQECLLQSKAPLNTNLQAAAASIT